MAKYYTYEGKQVGFVRKMVDNTILVEDAWVNEVRVHLAKHGYDTLLGFVAKILSAGGHPPVTRAQAWIILKNYSKMKFPMLSRIPKQMKSAQRATCLLR